MNTIIKLLDQREQYNYLILSRLHIETRGRTNEAFNGNWRKELKELYGENYDEEMLRTSHQYLFSEGYTKYSGSQALTVLGRDYIESWAKDFYLIETTDREILKKELPKKVFDYLGIASNSYTVATFISQLANSVQ